MCKPFEAACFCKVLFIAKTCAVQAFIIISVSSLISILNNREVHMIGRRKCSFWIPSLKALLIAD
jgi:hypothetical protein